MPPCQLACGLLRNNLLFVGGASAHRQRMRKTRKRLKARSNVEFILFAVKQAKAAEAYGFTRNECCRNLKTALHQYWQNRTLGLHGQAHKARIPRSRAARDLPLVDCVVEHVVPQMVIVDQLMDMPEPTTRTITALLRRWFRVMLVTRDEHARLNASGLRAAMPECWDGWDVFARYAAVGIDPAEGHSRANRRAG